MCHFIEAASLLPGWACCRCRTYNGLQRQECKRCRAKQHNLVLPDGILRCAACGWGYRAEFLSFRKLTNMKQTLDAAGCPVCGVPLAQAVLAKEE
jgi:hypothetical protein